MAIEDTIVVAANFEKLLVAVDSCEENDGDDLAKPFDFADVTFLVEDKPIYYNRSMLAMQSPHFKRLFYGSNANHDKEIRLKDKKFDDILAMLKLLKLSTNSNEQLIADASVEDLLKLAEEYQLSHVAAECEKFLLLKWKFRKSKIVKALELSAKFGLHTALNELLVKPGDDYPALLTDYNVEQILSIAKQYQLANVLDLCEMYLMRNWKQSAVKVVRAVELSAKFGLEKALANMLKTTAGMTSIITDGNVEPLLRLCKEYSLSEIRADCESFIMKNWIKKSEKALRAVEIAHEMVLPDLAAAFIPLAACRPLPEIDRSKEKLSTKLFSAVVHAAFAKEKASIARHRCFMKPETIALFALAAGSLGFLLCALLQAVLPDVTILVEGRPIRINRGILAAHSPHFKRLLYDATASHDNTPTIRLEDKKFDDIEPMLKLLKPSSCSNEQLITDANVEQLLQLAEEYQLSHVAAECEKFLLLKWKFSKSMIVKAMELSAKFGLHAALNDLLVKPADGYPALLTDENVEQILAIAKKYQLANITDLAEMYLQQHWKRFADELVRAVELYAKFGLEKPLADILRGAGSMLIFITEDNVEQLLRLGKEYGFAEILTDCEAYIATHWGSGKALRAIELAHEAKLPDLAKAFIPLAACRSLEEIDLSVDKLSTELFSAVLHVAFARVRNGISCSNFADWPACYNCANYHARCKHCTKVHAEKDVDAVVENMLKRNQQSKV